MDFRGEGEIAANGNGPGRAHVIVLGNSKGGTGKSTTAMHIVVGLLRGGYSVGALDLDLRQGTLERFLENRRAFAARRGVALPQPLHQTIGPSSESDPQSALAEERVRFNTALAQLEARCDFVVIDTPGGETELSFLSHSYADTLITPLNDSFIDLDVLARVDPETLKVLRPSRYSAMVWEIRKARALRDRRSIDWVILRNRLTSLDAHNKRAMADALTALATRIGFRFVAGLSERVIYRELFLAGLTLLDLRDESTGVKLSMSHVAARRELSDLLAAIGLGGQQDAAAVPLEAASQQEPAA
jgi:chromosome partitioning protein